MGDRDIVAAINDGQSCHGSGRRTTAASGSFTPAPAGYRNLDLRHVAASPQAKAKLIAAGACVSALMIGLPDSWFAVAGSL